MTQTTFPGLLSIEGRWKAVETRVTHVERTANAGQLQIAGLMFRPLVDKYEASRAVVPFSSWAVSEENCTISAWPSGRKSEDQKLINAMKALGMERTDTDLIELRLNQHLRELASQFKRSDPGLAHLHIDALYGFVGRFIVKSR